MQCGVRVAGYLIFCAVLLVSFAIVLSILLRSTDSYYHIYIFNFALVFILQCQKILNKCQNLPIFLHGVIISLYAVAVPYP